MSTTISPTALQDHRLKPRSRVRAWLKRIAFSLLALLIALPLAGVTYQIIATRVDNGNYPPPGQKVDIGGYSLHLFHGHDGALQRKCCPAAQLLTT